MNKLQWYTDWQSAEHARRFDFGLSLDIKNLQRSYESLNDVHLLNNRIERNQALTLVEVGCATGEFYRYLRIKHPHVNYFGTDISRVAITRAKEKYPQASFFVIDPSDEVTNQIRQLPMSSNPEIVYAKDVVHHQIDPFGFIYELLRLASETLIFTCRTRDVGETMLDPELSCQYHYNGWMPYIVMNLQDLINHIAKGFPGCEVVALRNHMILGGQHNRFLPKECYLAETGTAETAVGVFKRTAHPGKVSIEDQKELAFQFTLSSRLRRRIGATLRGLLFWNHS